MKFGLMYEIQVREPHYEGIEQERYKQVMAQTELADEVGFDHFWTVEHHFLREFSHRSAPEVTGPSLSVPSGFVSAMRWRCCRASITIRCGWPSGRRSWIS